MNIKITATSVRNAQPEKTVYDVRDSVMPGFFLRVRPSGKKSFYLYYRTKSGVRRNMLLGHVGAITAAQARDLAKTAQGQIASGGDPQADRISTRQKKKEEGGVNLAISWKRSTYPKSSQKRNLATSPFSAYGQIFDISIKAICPPSTIKPSPNGGR